MARLTPMPNTDVNRVIKTNKTQGLPSFDLNGFHVCAIRADIA